MPTYEFEAMDATGMEIKDEIDAPNEAEAQAMIRQMGYFVTKIVPQRPYSGRHGPGVHGQGLDDKIHFSVDLKYIYYGGIFILGLVFGLVVALAVAAS
jgi:type II secretory pathway component PulF